MNRSASRAGNTVSRTNRTFPTAAGLSAAAILLAACSSPGRLDKAGAVEHSVTTITLELPDTGDADATYFATDVAKRSHGTLHVVVDSSTYETADPANAARLIAAMRSGHVSFAYNPARDWAAAGLPGFEAMDTPFLVTTFDAAASLADSSLAPSILSQLSGFGLVGLGLIPTEPRQILSLAPLFALSAFHGISFRILDNPETAALISAIGADPVQGLSPEDTGTELQDGEIGAAETQSSAVLSNSYNAEAPYLTTYGLFPKFETIVATKSAWSALTRAEQDAVRQAVADTLVNSRQVPARESTELTTLCAAGLVLDEPSTAQLSALSEAAIRATPTGAQVASMIRKIRSAVAGTGPQLDAVTPPASCHVAHTIAEAKAFASASALQSGAPAASPTSIGGATIPPGIYVTTDTVADFRAAGQVGAEWNTAQTFQLNIYADGAVLETQEPDIGGATGYYVVKGDEVTFTWPTMGLTPETVRWSYLNGLLTFTIVDVQDGGSRIIYSTHPWRKVG
jgi:TRAP-type C4-dicarboxylate transport system substrate-binding protein